VGHRIVDGVRVLLGQLREHLSVPRLALAMALRLGAIQRDRLRTVGTADRERAQHELVALGLGLDRRRQPLDERAMPRSANRVQLLVGPIVLLE
jgi:hypothetical protein